MDSQQKQQKSDEWVSQMVGYEARDALRMACDLLCLDIDEMLPGVEQWCRPCIDRFRFRMEYAFNGKLRKTMWRVDIDYDADGTAGGGGWKDLSKAARVEVTRGW